MANQIVVSAGAKVRNLQDVIIGTSGVLTSLGFDVANGVPRLDVNGKILVSQLPNSVMEYKGTWNANTNTPTLANGTGNQGDVYLCNVAGTVDFGAGPIAFVVGDQVIYSGSIWQRASGATGTVTSVAITESGDSLNITGSPISTSGTINIGFNGTNLQYVNGAGNLTTFPTLITSIGLSMPSAFSVANSPLTANGTIAVTGAGVASQYIRGDGTLADFPSSGGGGSSVSYYLNGGTSQGTIGGTTYYEMSKTAVIGTGVDFTKSGDGFIVAFLTDANDPAQLNIPAGNWNYEIYASMSSNGGTPEMYAELYVYDGTTFTLISTSSNEIIYDGTALNLYTFAMAVPATSLTLTDRLAIKLYATNSGGKTTTIHTQDSHLCQIITTFSTGITALNGLTAQVQYFQVGTSGTDFNISSTTATHTFNIPDASATARGLITTGTQTIAGTKTFSDATKNNGGIFLQNASSNSLAGYMNIGGLTNGVKFTSGGGVSNTFTLPSATGYTFTFPNATGTIALTTDLSGYVTLATTQTITGVKTFNPSVTASGAIARGTNLTPTLVAAANGDVLVGLDINPTFTNGAFTGVTNYAARFNDNIFITNNRNNDTEIRVSNTTSNTASKTQIGATSSGGSMFMQKTAALFTTYKIINGGDGGLYNTSGDLYFLTEGFGNIKFAAGASSTVQARIFSNGNFGINQNTDAGFRLDVNGTARVSGVLTLSSTISNGTYTYTLPSATGTLALASDLTGYITAVTATSPLSSSGGTTPNITIAQATTSANGYLSSTDWNTFNNKQATITLTTTGTSGAATYNNTTGVFNIPNYAPDLSGYVTLATTQTISGTKTFTSFTKNDFGVLLNASGNYTAASGYNGFGGISNGIRVVIGQTAIHDLVFSASTNYTYTFPSATGTIALVGGSGVGTVTSVAALTIGTTGTDLSSTVANSTTTPVITLNVPTASAANRGALSSSDWTTFNNKQGTITLTTTGTSGAATFSANTLNIPDYGSALSGYLPLTGGTLTGALSGTTATFNAGTSRIVLANNFNTTGNTNSPKLSFFSFGDTATYAVTGPSIQKVNTGSYGEGRLAFSQHEGYDFTNETEVVSIFAGGNVLIQAGGTKTDSGYKLDVNGTGRFSGTSSLLYLNNTTATTGKVWRFSSASNGNFYITQESVVDALTLSVTTGAATFSSSVTATSFEVGNGQFYTARRSSGNALINVLGFETDDLVQVFSNSWKLRGTGGVGDEKITVTSTGAATFSNYVTIGNSSTTPAILTLYPSSSAKGWQITANNYIGSALEFTPATANGGTTFTTPAMLITSGGALCLGVTSAYGTNLLNVNGGIYATSSIAAVVAADIDMLAFVNTGATYSKACVVASMTATGGTGSYFFYGQQSTSTAAIKIFSNGNIQNTNNSYGAISDARLKENIKDATPKLDDLMKVKVRNYNLKGESNKQLGVISQELEAIFPNMIEESTNMGENMKIKGVKYSVFVPMLIKAVQEQQQQINELKQLLNK